MPRAQSDTKAEIQAVALELFARQGFDKTSLREIAERLNITKAALYYHFPSKDALLAELAQPMIDDLERFFAVARECGPGEARSVFERYLEVCFRHRQLMQGMLRDPAVHARLNVLTEVLYQRLDVDRALVGSDLPADRVRAIIAFGGLQDCVMLLGDEPLESYRAAAVDAALRALHEG